MPTDPPPLDPDLMRRLAELCEQFQADLRAGGAPRLEEVVQQVPEEARPRLFRDLLEREMRHRQEQGQSLTGEEASQRFTALGSWVPSVLVSCGLTGPEETLVLEAIQGLVAGQQYRLTGHASFFVGRGAGAHLTLSEDKSLSRIHFCIEYNPPQARLSDCNSKNGTYHNEARLQPGTRMDLRDGDLIRAGDLLLRVRLLGGDPTLTLSTPGGEDTRYRGGLLPGKPMVPGYTLEEVLGQGGMGVVHRARSNRDGQTVAIKLVLPALTPRADTRARFQREMDILEQLNHPHIVRFHEAGLTGGLVYFVMEYVEGQSASQRVKQEGPLSVPRVIELGCQLLDALAHAHERGFVHRDVKPGNLLLSGPAGQEILKLADFGLARAYQASAMSGLTMSGQSGGTPEFMPPEQVRNFRSVRPAADQYSAAASLYYLLTGQHIYERASSMMDLMVRILQEEPIPLRPGPVHPLMAGPLGPILQQALARQPEQRFPNVQAMRQALQAVS